MRTQPVGAGLGKMITYIILRGRSFLFRIFSQNKDNNIKEHHTVLVSESFGQFR
jgi:hypothetical protein